MFLRAPDSADAVESGASAEDTERSASPPTPLTVVPPRTLRASDSIPIKNQWFRHGLRRHRPWWTRSTARKKTTSLPMLMLILMVILRLLGLNLDGSSAALDGVTWTSLGSTHGVSPGHAFVSSTGAASGLGSGLDIGVTLPLDGLTSGVASGIDSSLVGSSRRGAALSTPLNSSPADEVTTTRRSTFTLTSSSSSATPNASQRDVQCLFLHNDHGFRCPLCNAWFPAWAGMRLHRISDHPKIKFTALSLYCGVQLLHLFPVTLGRSQPCFLLCSGTSAADTTRSSPNNGHPTFTPLAGLAYSSLWGCRLAALFDFNSDRFPSYRFLNYGPKLRLLDLFTHGETTSANKQPRVNTVSPAPQLVQPPSTPHDYILRFDGSCLGNGLTSSDPPCGAGAALFAPDGTVIWSLSSYLPPPTNPNNTAEYKALLAGLIGALHWRPRRLVIEGDSRLVIDQVLGRARCKTLALRPLRNNALALLRRLRSHDIDYSFRHIERNFNSVADRRSD
ncbi:hypothetical protein Ae201684P_000742 [Aphanomyces euteiches]|nr:hypothetical protein Ae201684P_000742 [Aphanomyces euteiches]